MFFKIFYEHGQETIHVLFLLKRRKALNFCCCNFECNNYNAVKTLLSYMVILLLNLLPKIRGVFLLKTMLYICL